MTCRYFLANEFFFIIIICGQFTSGKVENITDNEGSSHLNSQVGAEPIIHRVQTSAGKI